jgi:DNA polymerase-3 subunit delta'
MGDAHQRFPELGHGLLFYGKNGCGKHEFAEHFLLGSMFNKQAQAACGECEVVSG